MYSTSLFLTFLAKRATKRPIETVVLLGLIVSTAYLSILNISFSGESSLNNNVATHFLYTPNPHLSDFKNSPSNSLDSENNNPEWHVVEDTSKYLAANRLALLKLEIESPDSLYSSVFSNSNSNSNSNLRSSSHSSTNFLPSLLNDSISCPPSPSHSSFSSNNCKLLLMPYENVLYWTQTHLRLQFFSNSNTDINSKQTDDNNSNSKFTWLLKPVAQNSHAWKKWFQLSLHRFVNLIRSSDPFDIGIMFVAYVSMHMTFISLFSSMRKLGSKYWLATSVLLSSSFAFVLALVTIIHLGVPINLLMLSEGIPFLVVVIGFEHPLALTRAVFAPPGISSSISRIPPNQQTGVNRVLNAVAQTGPTILRDYLLEIALLFVGSIAGIPELKRFCYLSMWLLVYDFLMLFTFYAAILTIKQEIMRIKRHVDMAKALQEEGLSPRVAESVADSADRKSSAYSTSSLPISSSNSILKRIFFPFSSKSLQVKKRASISKASSLPPSASSTSSNASTIVNDGPFPDSHTKKVKSLSSPSTNLYCLNNSENDDLAETSFLTKRSSFGITKFKLLMVAGFVAFNVLNLSTSPLAGIHSKPPQISALSNFNSLLPSLKNSPLFQEAIKSSQSVSQLGPNGLGSVMITLFPPLKYELVNGDYHTELESAVVGIMNKWQTAVNDPVLSKIIVFALIVSVILNAYLFNASRYSGASVFFNDNNFQYPYDKSNLSSSSTAISSSSADDSLITSAGSDSAKFTRSYPSLSMKSCAFPNEDDGNDNSDTSDDQLSISVRRTVKSNSNDQAHKEKNNEKSLTGRKPSITSSDIPQALPITRTPRSIEETGKLLSLGKTSELSDDEVANIVLAGKLPLYALEKTLEDFNRAVAVRRKCIFSFGSSLSESKLPYRHYDFKRVFGACCENVVGYMPLPVGLAGPLNIDGIKYYIPMATTEGCLVASTMRGCKAINAGGGAETVLTQDGMTRGPCVSFPTLSRTGTAKIWLDSPEGQKAMKKAFDSTSRFARLVNIKTAIAGTNLFIRFRTTTGDAMGMNMISKGVEHALSFMSTTAGFPDMNIVSISGNYCTDKKPAALNWIEGRGKSVVAEAIVPSSIVSSVLKCDVDSLVKLNTSKNLIGSAMAGSIGGNNAHAANLVTAIFLATGQDPAQNVESSSCMTLMNKTSEGDLQVSVSMPCIEVGTIGGGTVLEPQASMLDLLGVRGPHPTNPGDNARQLAKIVACGVLAGELSLCAALAAGHLVQSHMVHNRAKQPTPSQPSQPSQPKATITSS